MRIANYGLALLGLASSHGLAAAQNDPDDAAATVADTYREYRRLQHGLRLNNQASRVEREQVAGAAAGVQVLWEKVFGVA